MHLNQPVPLAYYHLLEIMVLIYVIIATVALVPSLLWVAIAISYVAPRRPSRRLRADPSRPPSARVREISGVSPSRAPRVSGDAKILRTRAEGASNDRPI